LRLRWCPSELLHHARCEATDDAARQVGQAPVRPALPQQRPDLDNLLKALADAVCPDDDSHIWHLVGLSKVWGDDGRILIEEAEDV